MNAPPATPRELDQATTAHSQATPTDAEQTGPYVAPAEVTLGTIGKYRLRRELGHGAFGAVYLAYDPDLDREVALKLLHAHRLDSPTTVERFVREAKAAGQLRHPHIVAVLEAGQAPEATYLATAYLPGGTLAERLSQGPLAPVAAATLVAQVADGIHYAHTHGIIHRDIKPANVMFDEHQHAQLVDFGLARRLDHDPQMTADGQVLGTPAYMAPEQARGETVDPRADVYALGATLYHSLTGRAPFTGPVAKVLHDVLHTEPTAPRALAAVPRDLNTICLHALAKAPAARYPTAAAFRDDLQRFLRDEPVGVRPLNIAQRTWRWAKREPVVASLSGLLLVVTFAGAVAFAWKYVESAANFERAQERQQAALTNYLVGERRADEARHALTQLLRSTVLDGSDPTPLQAMAPELLTTVETQLHAVLDDHANPRPAAVQADLWAGLAFIHRVRHEPDQAIVAAQRALALRAPEAFAAAEDRLHMAHTHFNQRAWLDARDEYRNARFIAAKAVAVGNTADPARLALLRASVGEARTHLVGQDKAPLRAVELLQPLEPIARTLVTDSASALPARTAVAEYHLVYGQALEATQSPAAHDALDAAARLNVELWNELPTVDTFGFAAAWAYQTLALTKLPHGHDPAPARRQAVDVFSQLIRRHQTRVALEPNNADRRRPLAVAYQGMATTLVDLDRHAEAVNYLEKAIAEKRLIYQAHPTATERHALRDALRNYTRALTASQQFDTAYESIVARYQLAGNDLGERYQAALDGSRLVQAVRAAGQTEHAEQLQMRLRQLTAAVAPK